MLADFSAETRCGTALIGPGSVMCHTPRAIRYRVGALVCCTLLAWITPAGATEGDTDHRAAVAVGATVEKEISEQVSQLGPTIEIEFEAIDNWLEVEFGASGTSSQRATNWEFELQFKKPFQISNSVEIEPGLGPSWSHSQQSGEPPAAWGAEASVDFVFWRTKRVGWFVEPSYGMSFANGIKTSIGLSGGIICTFH